MKIEHMTDEQLEETGLKIKKERKLIPRDNEEITILPLLTYGDFLEAIKRLKIPSLAQFERDHWTHALIEAHIIAYEFMPEEDPKFWAPEEYWTVMLAIARTLSRTRKINDKTFDTLFINIKQEILRCIEGRNQVQWFR